jgi:hypothetical protein
VRRSVVAWLCVLGALASPRSAGAYELVGSDPDEPIDYGGNAIRDIRSSILRVEQRRSGRVLVLVIRSYEPLDGGWVLTASLDSAGGRAFDRILTMQPRYPGGPPARCSIFTRAGYVRYRPLAEGAFRRHGTAARCRVPIRNLAPSRPIRWSILSEEAGDPSAGNDRAPDRGMYG